MVRSINVTADLIEVQLAGDEGKEEAAAAAAAREPNWDRLMGINSFSIERALQVRRGGAVWFCGATGRLAEGLGGRGMSSCGARRFVQVSCRQISGAPGSAAPDLAALPAVPPCAG